MTKSIAALFMATLVLLTNGCDSPPPVAAVMTVHDSAGIVIVENAATNSADSLAWTLDPEPVAVAGDQGRGAAHIFGRIAGFELLSDHRIAVADGAASEIRFFDSTGKHVATTGRAGHGPGEYEYFSGMEKLRGDSLLVLDWEGQRRTVLGPRGEFVRTYMAPRRLLPGRSRSTMQTVRRHFSDGSFLIVTDRSACAQQTLVTLVNSGGGFCEDTVTLSRVTVAGDQAASYGRIIGSRIETLASKLFIVESVRDRHPTVSLETFADLLIYADARSYEIRIFGSDGRVKKIVRAPGHQKPPIRKPVVRNAAPGANGSEVRRIEAINAAYERSTWPELEPAFDAMLLDADGNIWIRERPAQSRAAGKSTFARWSVFDTSGRLQHSVRLPAEFTNIKIGSDRILVAQSDSFDVVSVRAYRLRKR